MTIAECYRRVSNAADGYDSAVDFIFADEGFVKLMTDLERERLFSGQNADGSWVEPPYTPFTVELKEEKGQPTDRVTLKDTGDFYEGFIVERKGDVVIFTSTDWKTNALVEKYGDAIFGLSTFDQADTWEASLHLIIQWFKRETGL